MHFGKLPTKRDREKSMEELIDSIPPEEFLRMERWPIKMTDRKLDEIHDLLHNKCKECRFCIKEEK